MINAFRMTAGLFRRLHYRKAEALGRDWGGKPLTVSERSRRLPYIVLGITCLLGYIFKAHCGAGWSDGIQYTSGCYSDAVPF